MQIGVVHLLDRISVAHTRAPASACARARELQAERFVDEISLIADDGRNDFMERVRQNGETFVDANREHCKRCGRDGLDCWLGGEPGLLALDAQALHAVFLVGDDLSGKR